MNTVEEKPAVGTDLPKAKVKRASRGISVVWVVPLVAAIVACYVVYDRIRELGPKITITFGDGNGIQAGQTPLKYRGVRIGEVTAVALSEDHKHAEVKVRLQRSAASIAKDGALFWIVRPELGLDRIAGLATVISGPEIQMSPGSGELKSEFTGLDRPPVAVESGGLSITLRTSRIGSLRPKAPVTYRGVEVGTVQKIQLSADAAAADVQVRIGKRYVGLVRHDSVFWNVSGASFSGGLFEGVQFKMESLRTLAIGGIAFATPPRVNGGRVKDGTVFRLYDGSKRVWLQWAPRIPIPPEN